MRQNYFLPFILLFCLNVFGQNAGFFGDGGGVLRLSHNSSPDFNTHEWNVNLGSTHSLWLKGGYAHTYKHSGGNICSPVFLHYRVYKVGVEEGGFATFQLPFIANSPFTTLANGGTINGNTFGDQKFENEMENINLLQNVTSNGTWVLEVYFSVNGSFSNSGGCEQEIFHSNFGNNFRIFFNIVDHFNAYESAVLISNCLNPNSYYRTSGEGPNQISTDNFDGENLGTFFQDSGDFLLQGAEVKTFKENYANVCIPMLHYIVYPTANPGGSFISINLDDVENCSCNGCPGTFNFGDPCNGLGTFNDQKWQNINQNIDLTTFPPGSYTIEVYFEIPGNNSGTSGCSDTKFVNNSGNNFKANFTIIPPTTSITTNP